MGEVTMIERVAREICMTLYGGYPVGKDEREKWPQWATATKVARAAIVTMREPTPEMLDAAYDSIHDGEDDLTVTVRLGDLRRYVERAKWTPQMLDTLNADEYRLTLEADINLRQTIVNERRRHDPCRPVPKHGSGP